MQNLLIWYPKCTTCQRAKAFLDARNVSFLTRDIKLIPLTYEELVTFHTRSGLPLKRWFNTSGLVYKELSLKDHLPDMSKDEQLRLLATNGMLVKRPILVLEDRVLVGFKEENWIAVLQ